jgi:hypothetical protein
MNKFQKLKQKNADRAMQGWECVDASYSLEGPATNGSAHARKPDAAAVPVSHLLDNKSLDENKLGSDFVDITLVLV